jgi:hypothetical protein
LILARFQSRESGYGYALVDPALKSRAKLTLSLRDREDGYCIYFSKTISPRHEYSDLPAIFSVPAYEGPSGLANGRITVIFSLHHSQTLNPGITNKRLFFNLFT